MCLGDRKSLHDGRWGTILRTLEEEERNWRKVPTETADGAQKTREIIGGMDAATTHTCPWTHMDRETPILTESTDKGTGQSQMRVTENTNELRGISANFPIAVK